MILGGIRGFCSRFVLALNLLTEPEFLENKINLTNAEFHEEPLHGTFWGNSF